MSNVVGVWMVTHPEKKIKGIVIHHLVVEGLFVLHPVADLNFVSVSISGQWA
jgi:hypothetical protein